MSKWINKDKFVNFVNQKKEEVNNVPPMADSYFLKWKTPEMGTVDKAKLYKIRILPDKNGEFYKKYFYHFFKSGEKSYYIKCLKTEDMNNFCPWCYVNQMLWRGNQNDKAKAYVYKRNERYVANAYIINDPRDVEQTEEKYKVNGKIRLYEFPKMIESKILSELTNDDEGYGSAIFDPENGYDLQIKVRAKKPDKNGKVWPDYTDTMFSRSKTSIVENIEDIDGIMDNRYSLIDYINSLNIEPEIQEKLLKQELVWEDVKDQFIRNFPSLYNEANNNVKEDSFQKETKQDDDKVKISSSDSEELTDEELLEHLNNLG